MKTERLILNLSKAESELIVKNNREALGIICKKCSSKRQYYLAKKKQWQCADCGFRTTLTSGTCLQHSKLSIKTWLLACWYMSRHKKSVSALRLQGLLGIGSFRAAHLLLMKIRNRMSQKQIDSIATQLKKFSKLKKRLAIRGTKGKPMNLAVFNNREKSSSFRIYLISVEDLKMYRPHKNSNRSKARSHEWDTRTFKTLNYIDSAKISKWLRRHLENLNRSLNGIHNGVSKKYRQLYIDEFTYRTNLSMAKIDMYQELLSDLLSGCWYS